VEEFRAFFIADRLALSLMNRRQIVAEILNFAKVARCKLADDARRTR
jgi:hypothetical protein